MTCLGMDRHRKHSSFSEEGDDDHEDSVQKSPCLSSPTNPLGYTRSRLSGCRSTNLDAHCDLHKHFRGYGHPIFLWHDGEAQKFLSNNGVLSRRALRLYVIGSLM
mmetsp:Transcript_19738/g.63738  ORF Transcript_19738/g.63738 Transcript_19738/m.63738 type:complete len:105 (+) Transcript_19738:694-1008(+)